MLRIKQYVFLDKNSFFEKVSLNEEKRRNTLSVLFLAIIILGLSLILTAKPDTPKDEIFCSECGASIQDTDEFCPFCGAEQESE